MYGQHIVVLINADVDARASIAANSHGLALARVANLVAGYYITVGASRQARLQTSERIKIKDLKVSSATN